MNCGNYCTHGGACSLPRGHDGQHSASGYCTWSDEESVSRAQADVTLAAKSPEGAAIVAIYGMVVPGNDD